MLKFVSLSACIALATVAPAVAQGSKGSAPPANAAASVDVGADLMTATYGDWQLRCRNAIPAAAGRPAIPRTCEVTQSVIIQGQSQPFAQLAFGKPSASEPLFFTTVLPINVAFPSAVRVATDEKDTQPVDLAWTRCMPGGCFASIAIKDDVLKRWRAKEDAGRFTFKNSAGQDVTMPFSFRGLARALDALSKEK